MGNNRRTSTEGEEDNIPRGRTVVEMKCRLQRAASERPAMNAVKQPKRRAT
jgi:hypothetical protein